MAKAEKKDQQSQLRPQDRIEESLLDARRIFLADAVGSETAAEIIEKLWYLDIKEPGKPILFVIHSPGGSVDSGFAIWDQIKMIQSPVTTLISGLAASFGSILSLAADKGKRFATPNARLMIHQPLIGSTIQGQATDLEIHAKEIIKTRKQLVEIYVEATGKKPKEIEEAIERDTWLSAQEALDFGLLDKIVTSFKEIK